MAAHMKKTTLYNARWDKARRAFLARNPLCVMCLESDLINPATVVNHILPHRLRFAQTAEEVKKAQKLFRGEKNWQPLCTQHHSATKQQMEKGNKGIKAMAVMKTGCRVIQIVTGINKINRGGGLKVPVNKAY